MQEEGVLQFAAPSCCLRLRHASRLASGHALRLHSSEEGQPRCRQSGLREAIVKIASDPRLGVGPIRSRCARMGHGCHTRYRKILRRCGRKLADVLKKATEHCPASPCRHQWVHIPRRTILSLAATKTAVMCSQALPAMGRTMRPRKGRLMPPVFETSSMEPVKNSAPHNTVTQPFGLPHPCTVVEFSQMIG